MTPPTEVEAVIYQLGWAAGWAAKDKELAYLWAVEKAARELLTCGGADTFTPAADNAWRDLRVAIEGKP